jgi:hypothetical protein
MRRRAGSRRPCPRLVAREDCCHTSTMTLLGAAELGLSLGVGLAVAGLPRVAYRVMLGSWGLSDLSAMRSRFRSGIAALIVVSCVEFLACKVFGLPFAGILGGSVLTAYAAHCSRAPRRIRRAQALCKALLDRSTREASFAPLERELARWRARVTRSGFLPPRTRRTRPTCGRLWT